MAASGLMLSFRTTCALSKFNKTIPILYRQASQAVSYEDTLTHPDCNVTTLKNQLKVATEETGAASATVGLWIDLGSRHETENNNGINSLLEHLYSRGTAKRSQVVLENELTSSGIQLDSYVSRDHLAVYAKCLSSDVPKAVEILSDLVQNGSFSEAEIETGKDNLMNELNASETDLGVVIMDYLHATAFQGTTLGRSPLGTTQSIRNLDKASVESFHKSFVKPYRIVLAGAGGVKHADLVKLGDEHLGSMLPSYENGIPVLPPSRFTGSEIRARYDDEALLHLAIAVEAPGAESEDSLPMQIVSSLIGSWDKTVGGGINSAGKMSLASSSIELCHAYKSFNLAYQGTGLWGAYVVCDRLSIADFLYNLQGEWMRICTSATEFEVERAKNALRTAIFSRTTDTSLVCQDVAKQALTLGRRIPYHEMESRLKAIDAGVVRDVALKYMYDKCPAVASYGPTEQVPDYNRIRSAMYWMRF